MDNDTLEHFRKATQVILDLEYFDLWLNDERTIKLSLIKVPGDQRGKGLGTAAMRDLTTFADDNNMRIVLTPQGYNRCGDKSKRNTNKLIRWYKRFGFVVNRGRNKDFRIYDYMYREAQ